MIEEHSPSTSVTRDSASPPPTACDPALRSPAGFPHIAELEHSEKLFYPGTDTRPLFGRSAFVGLGYGKLGVPIDVAVFLLVAPIFDRMQFLVVDQFQRINRVPEQAVLSGASALSKVLRNGIKAYQLSGEVALASELMSTRSFDEILQNTKQQLLKIRSVPEGERAILATIPPGRAPDLTYTLNEIALSKFLRDQVGFSIKVGPERERLYDEVMQRMNVGLEYAYVVDALPACTSRPEPVVHYIPNNFGAYGGKRIFLQDSPADILKKLAASAPQTLAYLRQLANAASARLGLPIIAGPRFAETPSFECTRAIRDALVEAVVVPLLQEDR